MMKPRHTLLFLTGILIVLAALTIFAPGDLFVGDSFQIKIPSLAELFDTATVRTDTAITQVYDLSRQMQKETDKDTAESKPVKDSVIVHIDSTRTDTLHVKKQLFDIKNIRIQAFEFPEDNKVLLNAFFRLLATGAADSTLIRILHYGDSQIERDRVTSYLRNMFQTKFGGSGPGLLPATQPYGKLMSVFHETSPNWKRYTTFGKIDHSLGHHRYGPMAAVTRMVKADDQEDSIYRASITIRKNKFSYKTLQRYTQCQLLLGNCPDTATIQLYADGLLLETEKCTTSFLKKIKFIFPDFTQEIEIRFSSRDEVEVYGMMLDKKTGIAIDNIALRGSAGMEFTHIEPDHLRASFAFMNPKLLILEFGGNIAPTQAKNYSFYGKRLYREISFLKSLLPSDVAIIVIGIGDMSIK
jgi:hypothetical protein